MSPGSGRKSLRKYEVTNLLFFLGLILGLGILVTFVFRHYGTRNQVIEEESDLGVVSEALSDASDVGLFYLGTKISETQRQYRSRLEIPVTDAGLPKALFDLPGVDAVTLDQRILIIRTSGSVRWDAIRPGVRRIVSHHLHIHY